VIIIQSGIKGKCFTAASFMAGSSDEMVRTDDMTACTDSVSILLKNTPLSPQLPTAVRVGHYEAEAPVPLHRLP